MLRERPDRLIVIVFIYRGHSMKQQQMKRTLLAALVSGIFLPIGAQAATEAELLQKLEALTKEVEALKAQVAAQQKATQQVADKVEVAESKSLGK